MTLYRTEIAPSRRPESSSSGDARLDLVSWGVPFCLSASCDALLERMRQHAPFASMECHFPAVTRTTFTLRRFGSEELYQVQADDRLLTEAEPLEISLQQLGAHLMNHVAERAPGYVFLHAGVVAWQDRALLLPGFSHAGKSTLVAELVRAGATYYSDEFALLDAGGRVHPFLRTLQMRRPGRSEQTPLPLAQLNGRAGTGALAVSLVVFTEFAEGACWTPEVLTSGQAILGMLQHAVSAQRTPARVLSTLTAALRHAAAWRSMRGEATATAAALLAALATGEPLA